MVAQGNGSYSTQLIDGDGNFNFTGAVEFMNHVELAQCGMQYAVVSIMGPQSGGKSTLLNHLFRTKFVEMNAILRRGQTTKGIWIANCIEITPTTIVMDLEGCDGMERGEDDTVFERQSALFALAVSDILMINMWCHDIGREQGASKPLLKTIFEVMMRLFNPRKTTLMFVIRDKSRTPLDVLEAILRSSVQKIWDAIPKTAAHKDLLLSECFNVVVTALPSYEANEELFKEEVAQLRNRFFNCISPGGLAGDRQCVIPASEFTFSAQEIWKIIKENKELDLPSHKVMVATVRCGEIADEIYLKFTTSESWSELARSVSAHTCPASGFGKKISSLISRNISEYNSRVTYFDEGIQIGKRKELEDKLEHLIQPAVYIFVGTLVEISLPIFKDTFQKEINEGRKFKAASISCMESCLAEFEEFCQDMVPEFAHGLIPEVRVKLQREMDRHTTLSRSSKLDEIAATQEGILSRELLHQVDALLQLAEKGTWQKIYNFFQEVTGRVESSLLKELEEFELDKASSDEMIGRIKTCGKSLIISTVKEQAESVVGRMTDRFLAALRSSPKSFKPLIFFVGFHSTDVKTTTKEALERAVRMLSVLVALSWGQHECSRVETLVESTLVNTLLGGGNKSDLASKTWKEVAGADVTLIETAECISLWQRFHDQISSKMTGAEREASEEMLAGLLGGPLGQAIWRLVCQPENV